MSVNDVVKDTDFKMKKAIDFYQNELRGVRTGRASTALVDHLRVDYYGNLTPVNQLATISAPQADMIVIKPFDAASIKDIEKAIKTSDLSLAPIVDGKLIRLNIPPLSGERRKQLANQVKQMGEHTKVNIRNIRRDANKQLDDEQKAKLITEDDRDKGKSDIDDMTKKYTIKIDDAIKAKSDEIING